MQAEASTPLLRIFIKFTLIHILLLITFGLVQLLIADAALRCLIRMLRLILLLFFDSVPHILREEIVV